MLYDKITLMEGSDISNLTVESGTSFPQNADAGELFFKTTDQMLYIYNGSSWVEAGSSGGATGGTGNPAFYENDQSITADYTLTAGKNAMSAGPITIATGVTVTIPTGATWTIV